MERWREPGRADREKEGGIRKIKEKGQTITFAMPGALSELKLQRKGKSDLQDGPRS